jgi:twitching motility two-component system response regulator PilH
MSSPISWFRRLLGGNDGPPAAREPRPPVDAPVPDAAAPASPPVLPATPETESAEAPPLAARVLVIDDSSTVVVMLKRILEQAGYRTLEAYDAETGIEIARAELPDLVFLDIVLPNMNGFAALRNLRREPRTARVPVIMMSGNEQATEQFYAQKIGADDFMKKPFSRPEVIARVERVLRREPRTAGGSPAP